MKRPGHGESIRLRNGAVLLEVLIALTVLSVSALGFVAFASQATNATRRAHEAESELRRASAFLEAVALWPREDLDRHLGDRRVGFWRLRVTRLAPTIYEVELRDSSEARRLLSTALFRAENPSPDERYVSR